MTRARKALKFAEEELHEGHQAWQLRQLLAELLTVDLLVAGYLSGWSRHWGLQTSTWADWRFVLVGSLP